MIPMVLGTPEMHEGKTYVDGTLRDLQLPKPEGLEGQRTCKENRFRVKVYFCKRSFSPKHVI